MNRTITDSADDLTHIAEVLSQSAADIIPSTAALPEVIFEAPRNAAFGDFASNVALVLAKQARRPPQQLAVELVERMFARDATLHTLVSEVTPSGGFINIRMSPVYWQRVVAAILREGSSYGRLPSTGVRVSLEFGSANPTGPLGAVQGRTLAIGDSLARAMRFCGIDVITEWVTNDAGSQIETLARSVYARYRQQTDASYPFPEDGYAADYIGEIAQRIREQDGARFEGADEAEWMPHFTDVPLQTLVTEQKKTCERFRVSYDRWQSEKAMHESGAVERGIAALRERNLVFEEDGALWMRTTQFGDDKDRVVVRSDGRPTYYGADVAYHYDKLERADRALLILGPDHHGYVARLAAVAAAFDRPGAIEVLIAQQMTLEREGEIVYMSKRAGNVLPLETIIEEVGVDAARYFFAATHTDSPMTFDVTLAKEQSSENPVYYVQYGHARIASLERNAPAALQEPARRGESLERLTAPAELALMHRLAEFPQTVAAVVEGRAPHRLIRYAREVASDFHQFYMACKVLSDDVALSTARLGLSHATKIILAQTLELLGVSAPERM